MKASEKTELQMIYKKMLFLPKKSILKNTTYFFQVTCFRIITCAFVLMSTDCFSHTDHFWKMQLSVKLYCLILS